MNHCQLWNSLVINLLTVVKHGIRPNFTMIEARKLFAAPYQPRPFSFSVRSATDRCAEGVVSIDEDGGAPVWTMCARRSEQTMKFPAWTESGWVDM